MNNNNTLTTHSHKPADQSAWIQTVGSILIICALIGLSLVTIRLIFTPGCVWDTHDMLFNMERYAAAHLAVQDGHHCAQWSRDINYGYGYPLLLFYPPLSVYIIVLLHMAGAGILTATKFLIGFSMVLAGLLAYRLGRYLWKDRLSAWLTSVCFLLLPYHLLTVMTRGAIAEFVAQALLPGVLLGYLRLTESSHRRLIPATLFCAGLILTHNASWILAMPTILITTWVYGNFTRKIIFRSMVATTLGLGLSAWYWLPAYIEKSLVKISNLKHANHLSYLNHFSNFDEIFNELWAYSGLGTVLTGVWVLACLGLWISPKRANGKTIFILLLQTPVIILCCSALSKPLWDNVEVLQFVQFPWRLTAMAGLTTAAAAPAMLRLTKHRSWHVVSVVVVTIGLYYSASLQTQRPIFRFNDTAGLNSNQLRKSGTTTVVADEYLPNTVSIHPEEKYGIRDTTWELENTHAVCVPDLDLSHHISAFVIADTHTSVRVNCLNFPGWTASIDNQSITIETIEKTGLMRLTIPPGDHYVELHFKKTPIRQAGSVLAVIFSLILLVAWSMKPAGIIKQDTDGSGIVERS